MLIELFFQSQTFELTDETEDKTEEEEPEVKGEELEEDLPPYPEINFTSDLGVT